MTATLIEPPPPAPLPRVRSRRRRVIVVLLVLALVAAGWSGKRWYDHIRSDVRYGTTLVTSDGMAARYGIHVDLLAVTAAGGIIELRYQVVDPDKAAPLIHDIAASPKLINEGSGATIVMSSPHHHHGNELDLGATYFFLMANTNQALHPGDLATLVIGDARMEHIQVEG